MTTERGVPAPGRDAALRKCPGEYGRLCVEFE
jgi:hypothetical protein